MTASAGSEAFGAIPGMDFLKTLMPGAGGASPAAAGMAWMLPTVDLEELDKRIKDLKAVQFWLEQNSRMLASTIQTLEVQRMTVATLKGMNVSMKEAMGQWTAAAQSAVHAAATAQAEESAEPTVAAPAATAAEQPPASADPAPGATAEAILPQALQWWDQLSRQFAQIATAAVETASASVDSALQTPAAPEAGSGSAASAKRRRSPRAATASTASKAATKSARSRSRPRTSSRS